MSKIRKSAKGEECQVRIPKVCNFNPETVVLAHLGGAGMGMKANDIHGTYCCSACHDVIDGRVITGYPSDSIRVMLLDGMVRTQLILIDKGLLVVK
ncbi:MAG: DUF1364 domain-containing protein [Deltaproteobacteria bacterium]|nr:DUF1364 domain-containing protein [Deltaproteobacteria bacterium]